MGFLLGGVALGLVLWLWLPSLIRQRVEALARDSLGLPASIADVTVRAGGFDLVGLEVGRVGDGASLAVGAAKIDVGLLAALLQGSRAVERVELSGVRVAADVASPAFASLITKVRARGSHSAGAGEAAEPPKLPEVQAQVVSVAIKRGSAGLTTVSGATLEVRGGQASLRAAQVKLELVQRGLSAILGGVKVEGARSDRWRIKAVTVEHLALRADPAPAAGAQPSEASVGAADPKAVFATPSFATAIAAFQPGATLIVAAGSFMEGRLAVLRGLSGRLSVERAGEVRVTGHGAAERGGRLDVDLRVWPQELRADGKVSLEQLPLTLLVPLLPSVPWFEPEASRIDAELSVKTDSIEQVSLAGSARLDKGAIFSPRIAPGPVRDVHVELEGKGLWFPLRRRLEVTEGQLRLGKPKIALSGALELTADHYVVQLDANVPRVDCTDAVQSIPADLLADLALAEWSGSISGRLQLQVDSRELEKTVLQMDVRDQCEFVSLPAMADLRRFSQPFVHSVVEPDDTTFEMETGPGTDAWTPIGSISPFLIYAVLTHEDPQFFAHGGFSPKHIRNALVRNLQEGRYVVGASTITMQLVKNVFLKREKTLARKLQEVLLTWWVERAMDKRDILELYLNVIEYGPGIYGIRSAAKHYFNRLPAELSPAESAFFATILPNPKRYHSFFERGTVTPTWATTMRKLIERLRERGAYDAAAADYGMREIEHFRFSPEGSAAPPRVITGATAPLPFEADAAQSLGDFGDDFGFDDAPAPDGYD